MERVLSAFAEVGLHVKVATSGYVESEPTLNTTSMMMPIHITYQATVSTISSTRSKVDLSALDEIASSESPTEMQIAFTNYYYSLSLDSLAAAEKVLANNDIGIVLWKMSASIADPTPPHRSRSP